MKFVVQYQAWGRIEREEIEAMSVDAARIEVNRTLIAPDAKVLSVEPVKQ